MPGFKPRHLTTDLYAPQSHCLIRQFWLLNQRKSHLNTSNVKRNMRFYNFQIINYFSWRIEIVLCYCGFHWCGFYSCGDFKKVLKYLPDADFMYYFLSSCIFSCSLITNDSALLMQIWFIWIYFPDPKNAWAKNQIYMKLTFDEKGSYMNH